MARTETRKPHLSHKTQVCARPTSALSPQIPQRPQQERSNSPYDRRGFLLTPRISTPRRIPPTHVVRRPAREVQTTSSGPCRPERSGDVPERYVQAKNEICRLVPRDRRLVLVPVLTGELLSRTYVVFVKLFFRVALADVRDPDVLESDFMQHISEDHLEFRGIPGTPYLSRDSHVR